MRGNCILVNGTDTYSGKFEQGFIAAGETSLKPGTIYQRDPAVALKSGRHTYKHYQPSAAGALPKGPFYVLLEDSRNGRTVSDAYAAGDWGFFYAPLPGDALNLLVKNLAGTADDHALDEALMVDQLTGMLIVASGTPATIVAQLQEAIVDPVVDTLAWCNWTGH
jgi:hypothetical protein